MYQRKYIGIDLHSDNFYAHYLNEKEEHSELYRLDALGISDFIKSLNKKDKIAVEASGNTLNFTNQVEPFVSEIKIVPPNKFSVIGKSALKTDSLESISTLILSILLLGSERLLRRKHPEKFKSFQNHLRGLDSGELEKLLSHSMDNWRTIQLTLCNRKVYIGYVIEMPTYNAEKKHQRFFSFLPLYSTYRDSECLKIKDDITDYSLFALMLKDPDTRKKYKVGEAGGISEESIIESLETGVLIDVEDILTAQMFDSKIFNAFNDECATSVPKAK